MPDSARLGKTLTLSDFEVDMVELRQMLDRLAATEAGGALSG